MALKVKRKEEDEDIEVIDKLGECAKELNEALDYWKEILVNRDKEIDALKVALVSKQHVMCIGKPGIAKTLLAKKAFRSFVGDDLNVFDITLMKGTNVDEVFGPMNIKALKEDGRIHYNTEGMLPRAQLAIVDEVYRAADMLLPATLRILNEREFKNGSVWEKCPLWTALATTNFITENSELEAFHDRWLFRINVEPLSTQVQRIAAAERHLTIEESKPAKKCAWDSVVYLHDEAKKYAVDEEVLLMYDELVQTYKRAIGTSEYISDRRYCQSFALCLSYAALQGHDAPEINPEHLYAAHYGLTTLNNKAQTDAFLAAFEQIVGSYVSEKDVSEKIAKFEKVSAKMQDSYDADNMDDEEKAELWLKSKRYLDTINNFSPENQPRNKHNLNKLNQAKNRLESLVAEITPKLDKATVTRVAERLKREREQAAQ